MPCNQLIFNANLHPFGMGMPERNFSSDAYKYGFGGQEKDDEISGSGNSYDFDFRFYNSRIGRFLSVDPLINDFPSNSPYTFAENCPIRFIELEGKEIAEPDLFIIAQIAIGVLETEVATTGNNSTVFAGITRTEILNQLKSKLQNAQCAIIVGTANSGGWYCGTAADMVVAALYNPLAYVSMVWDLATKGEVNAMGGKKVTATVPDWAKSPSVSGGKIQGIDIVEYIVRTAIRSAENDHSEKDSKLDTPESQGTWPSEQRQQLSLFGLETNHSTYWRFQNNSSLRKIEKAVKGGYLPVVFENHKLSHPTLGKQTVTIGGIEVNAGIHYIVITKFERNKKDKTITFSFISYGVEHTETVSFKHFKKGMKGYWIPENQKGAGGKPKK